MFGINCIRNFLKKFDKIIETFLLLKQNLHILVKLENIHQSGLSNTVTIIHLKTRFAYRLFAKRKKEKERERFEIYFY